MKTQIIVHSHSGNTYRAVMALDEGLEATGHEALITRIKTLPDYRPGAKLSCLAASPGTGEAEVLVLAAPVHAFGLSTAMQHWLAQAELPPGRPIAALLTMGFPFASWGGRQALRRLEELCAAKGAKVGAARIVPWHFPGRAARVAEMVRALVGFVEQAKQPGV